MVITFALQLLPLRIQLCPPILLSKGVKLDCPVIRSFRDFNKETTVIHYLVNFDAAAQASPPQLDESDQVDSFQTHSELSLTTSLDLKLGIRQHFQEQQPPPFYHAEAESNAQQLQGHPHDAPIPSWMSSLLHAFADHAATELEEEGPVAYLDTWFSTGFTEKGLEESRPLRLDQCSQMWRQDIVETWRDRINVNLPLFFSWVHPVPPEPPTSTSIGHLIVYQNIPRSLVPVLISMKFLSASQERLGQVALLLQTPTDS